MEKIEINTLNDVEGFFQLLYDKYNLLFHPDDSFADFGDGTGGDLFTKEEADYLDSVMERCFEVSEKNGTNIYEVMEPIQKKEFKKRGLM